MNIILCGFKNSGKTSVGRLLAKAIAFDFIDIDLMISEQHFLLTGDQLTVRKIYHQYGEDYFRKLEKQCVASLDHISNTVVATGGGAVFNAASRKKLCTLGELIYLHVEKEILWQRINKAETTPAFLDKKNPEKSFFEHYHNREKTYEDIAQHTIKASNKNQQAISQEIKNLLFDVNNKKRNRE